MASLASLIHDHSRLTREHVNHLNRLMSEWGMLADVCFSDLLLYVPTTDDRWLIAGQVRPATAQTVYPFDWVGTFANESESAVLQKAFDGGSIFEGEVQTDDLPAGARMMALPVRHDDQSIAVVTREWVERSERPPGELERNYLAVFDRFAQMIVEGAFPYPGRVGDISVAPRVGDGVVVVDGDARVQYASPNALSVLHRVGITASPVSMRLSELGFYGEPVRRAFERRLPVVEEFEQSEEVALLCRCLPLIEDGQVVGGFMLMRDVSDLRMRDRLLLSKDATIREIHHRVKNNLQTISSLLRLQGRRLHNPEAKAAVAESVRRIRTIALVHESLSREPGEDVTLLEIVRPLLRLAEESLHSEDRPLKFSVIGDGGRIPAKVATPLSIVLTELLQNAVDHGFGEEHTGGRVVVGLAADAERLGVTVTDDGNGLAAGFDLDQATGLGLSIVRTLVTTELNGTIAMRPVTADDLERAGLVVGGSGPPHGTIVELSVPTEE